jgi:hypothetical protein
MPFHIPFEHRRQHRPIYIGFDVPQRPKRKFNWWGFWGLLMSVGSFATAGFASPLALLVSLNGMRKTKGPRKAAATGAVFSLAGIGLATAIVFGIMADQQHRQERRMQRQIAAQIEEAQQVFQVANEELQYYRDANGTLPSGVDGNMLLLKHVDPWGGELRFDTKDGQAFIRSVGPDGISNSKDDIRFEVEGEVELASVSGVPMD